LPLSDSTWSISQSTWDSRIESLARAIRATSTAGALYLALGGILFAGLTRLQRQKEVTPLVLLAAVDFFAEILMSCVSGRGYFHYFVSWAPSIGILCAYLGYATVRFAGTETMQVWKSRSVSAGTLLLAVAIVVVNAALFQATALKFVHREKSFPGLSAVSEYLVSHTRTTDRIFVWGYAPEVYLMSQRKAPTGVATLERRPSANKVNRLGLFDLSWTIA
jgi:hypothetical protein